MRQVLVILAVVVGLLVLDQVALWAERRGWIYWRKKKPSGGSAVVLGPVFDLFQPSHVHVVEEQQRQEIEADQAEGGEPRSPGR